MIAIVDFHVAPADQPRALEVLSADGATATGAVPGCLAFRVFANHGDATHVGLMHEWDGPDALAAYLGSDHFAKIGSVLRPMMKGPPVSRRFEATLVETAR
ncbi:putative quinol monooxygenase [Yoonia sp. R2331]|uniref:putative quinol monooxygenase n=1 Tax=Yoonia sp. R2331 TaxID=3237238 RepID=UPI0034E4740C